MSDIKIADNIIPAGYANAIELDITQTGFPWFYIDDVTNENYGNNSGLVHPAFDFGKEPSNWFPFIKPLIYSIEDIHGKPITQLLRIRVGFLTPDEEAQMYNTPHIDFTMSHYTACYYVNDSDGDTIIFDQKMSDVNASTMTEQELKDYVEKTTFTVADQCSPKKGRVCIFDGTRFHASSKPKQHKKRFVISVNFI